MGDEKAPAAVAQSTSMEEKKRDNMWTNLLSKATKTSIDAQSTVIVLGDKKNGKGSLLNKFKERQSDVNAQHVEYLIDYSYVNVKNIYDDDPDEVRAHMSIWEMSNPNQAATLLPSFLEANGLGHCCYMLTLDLSKPWSLQEQLDNWMGVLTKAHSAVFDKFPEEEQNRLKERLSRFQQFFIDPSQQNAEDAPDAQAQAEIKTDMSMPPINLGVPLVVVGCKGDLLTETFSQQSGAGDRFEYITRKLRKWCLQYGASLFFTSATGADGTGITALQEYLYHRLYGFDLKSSAKLVGSDSDYSLYVPAGFDSDTMLNSFEVRKTSWAEDAGFSDVFTAPAVKQTATRKNNDKVVEAEANDLFFKKLKFQFQNTKRAFSPKDPSERKSQAEAVRALAQQGSGSQSKEMLNTLAAKSPTGARKGDNKDHHAVKDFFKQLLSTSGAAPAGGRPSSGGAAAKEALSSMKKTSS